MKYERIKYPDGQISVKITDTGGPLEIKERINSYEDLFFLRALADAIHAVYADPVIHVAIPCMFGQRSDRRFDPHQSFDLKLIAEVINSCKFNSVNILDPHSDVVIALINNSYKDGVEHFVTQAVESIAKLTKEEIVLVSPDAGAYKKVFELGTNLELPVVAGVKHRDSEGKIDLQFTGDVKDKNCLIVDDICDGGYTFIVLAKKLLEQGAKRVYLYVTHGYFSKGINVLEDCGLSHIFCTNSVKDVDHPFVTQFKII